MRSKLGINMEHSAMVFAHSMHYNQKRKYSGEPYINHPKSVVKLLDLADNVSSEMIQAAWLHDVVEDCGVELKLIAKVFGDKVAKLVDELTDVSIGVAGNRAYRKQLDLEHTAKASPEAKTIKLADLIDNSYSIRERDSKFAKTYMLEKIRLLEVLQEGDARLYNLAKNIVEDYRSKER